MHKFPKMSKHGGTRHPRPSRATGGAATPPESVQTRGLDSVSRRRHACARPTPPPCAGAALTPTITMRLRRTHVHDAATPVLEDADAAEVEEAAGRCVF